MSDLPNTPQPPTPLGPAEINEWLDYQNEELLRRRDEEILPALASMGDKIADGDDETAGKFAENARMARSLLRTADARRQEHKRPFLDGGRCVDQWDRGFGQKLLDALRPVENALLRFANAKADAERQRREQQAQQAAEEAARRQKEAAKAVLRNPLGADVDGKLQAAAEAAEDAQRAVDSAAAPPAELGRVRGIYGAVASPRRSWRYEVEDIDAVPREYLCLDDSKIRDAARKRDSKTNRPTTTIPGIRWVEVRSLGGAQETV